MASRVTGINIASGRLSEALFDTSFAMIDTWTHAVTAERVRSDSVNQYFAPDNEINASQAAWRDHGHVSGSKGRKRSLLPSKMAFLLPPPYLIVCAIFIGLLALQVVNFNDIYNRYS